MTKMYLKFDDSVYLVQQEPEGTPYFVEGTDMVTVSFDNPKIVISLHIEEGICSVYSEGGDFRIDHTHQTHV